MKKFFLIIAIILLSIITLNVQAEDTTLYCEYVDAYDPAGINGQVLYMMVLQMYSSDNGTENGPSFDYEFLDARGNEIYTELSPSNLDFLEMYGMLQNGLLQCPALAVKGSGDKMGALILWSQASNSSSNDQYLSVSKQECPTTGCKFEDMPGMAEDEVCVYSGPSGTIKIEPISSGNKCKVTYPDNTSEFRTDVCSLPVAGACSDIFYNKRTKKIQISRRDYKQFFEEIGDHYDPTFHEFVCGSDKANVEYYCAGTCKFPNNKSINCSELDEMIEASADICKESGILKALRFIGYLLYVAKVVIPIILIIMGSIDFGKAVISSNQDAVSKNAKIFATRIVAAIIVFLLPTIVNFAFNLVKPLTSKYQNCETCIFHPDKCQINDTSKN